jgi:hypothetical protein
VATEAQGSAEEVRGQCTAAQLPIFDALCSLVRKHAGACHEVAWPKQRILSFGVGPKKMSQHHCYVAIYPAHINLGFYHGATLSDPTALLEGTGKGLRHVKVKSLAAVNGAAFAQLVRAAIADRASHRDEA